MNKIIAVALPKGGVGKTTTAVNLAASFAVYEKRTLLIDADPSNTCAPALGIPFSNLTGGLFDLLTNSRPYDKILHKTDLEYLDFIPSDTKILDSEERLGQVVHNYFRLREIARSKFNIYDYIIIDCPPYLGGITRLVFNAVDSVIIPLKTAQFSLIALSKLLEVLSSVKLNSNKNINIEGILLTMLETNTLAAQLTEERLYPQYGRYVFKNYIPKSTSVAESTYYGKPVILHNARSIGSKAYLELADEIIVRNRECPVKSLIKESSISKTSDITPREISLSQNRPNPFSHSTVIHFKIPSSMKVKLSVLNLFMEEIEILVDTKMAAGEYDITWIPKDLNNGVYYYRFDAGGLFKMNKMILAR